MRGSDRTYTIRELTKEFGLTARALRFYEAEGSGRTPPVTARPAYTAGATARV